MSSTTPESMNWLQANSTTISVMILVPNDKTKEMLVQELFLWHFGSEAPCTVHRCRIDGPEPYMDNVNVVEMVLEFGDRRAADGYFENMIPQLEAFGYELGPLQPYVVRE